MQEPLDRTDHLLEQGNTSAPRTCFQRSVWTDQEGNQEALWRQEAG